MKYYGDITKQLQIILVKRWVEENWFARVICRIIGKPINPKLPYPNIIKLVGRLGEVVYENSSKLY